MDATILDDSHEVKVVDLLQIVLSPLMAGTLGGLLATWVTFVPCFLFIFLGAPFIETLRGNKALHGALSAITAAVVGVVLNSHQDARNLLRYGGMRPDRDWLQFDCALSYGLVEYLRTLDVLHQFGWSPSRCIPHGGHQMSLNIAAGLGLGGNESYQDLFQPYGGFPRREGRGRAHRHARPARDRVRGQVGPDQGDAGTGRVAGALTRLPARRNIGPFRIRTRGHRAGPQQDWVFALLLALIGSSFAALLAVAFLGAVRSSSARAFLAYLRQHRL